MNTNVTRLGGFEYELTPRTYEQLVALFSSYLLKVAPSVRPTRDMSNDLIELVSGSGWRFAAHDQQDEEDQGDAGPNDQDEDEEPDQRTNTGFTYYSGNRTRDDMEQLVRDYYRHRLNNIKLVVDANLAAERFAEDMVCMFEWSGWQTPQQRTFTDRLRKEQKELVDSALCAEAKYHRADTRHTAEECPYPRLEILEGRGHIGPVSYGVGGTSSVNVRSSGMVSSPGYGGVGGQAKVWFPDFHVCEGVGRHVVQTQHPMQLCPLSVQSVGGGGRSEASPTPEVGIGLPANRNWMPREVVDMTQWVPAMTGPLPAGTEYLRIEARTGVIGGKEDMPSTYWYQKKRELPRSEGAYILAKVKGRVDKLPLRYAYSHTPMSRGTARWGWFNFDGYLIPVEDIESWEEIEL